MRFNASSYTDRLLVDVDPMPGGLQWMAADKKVDILADGRPSFWQ